MCAIRSFKKKKKKEGESNTKDICTATRCSEASSAVCFCSYNQRNLSNVLQMQCFECLLMWNSPLATPENDRLWQCKDPVVSATANALSTKTVFVCFLFMTKKLTDETCASVT